MKYRLTALGDNRSNLLNKLVIDVMREKKLIGDVEIQETLQGPGSLVNTKSDDVYLNDIKFNVHLLPNRIDYFTNVDDYLSKELIKDLFSNLLETKQFNRFAIEISKTINAENLLKTINDELGTMNNLNINISTTNRKIIDNATCVLAKNIHTEENLIKSVVEINNAILVEKDNHIDFLNSIEKVIKMVEDEAR